MPPIKSCDVACGSLKSVYLSYIVHAAEFLNLVNYIKKTFIT